jgi:beta-lactamase superfamily II metal-dependent hydrolase
MSTTEDLTPETWLEKGKRVGEAAAETVRQTDRMLDGPPRFAVHFLDMGTAKYGDCIVVEVGKTRVLVDGGHPGDWRSGRGTRSIPEQLEEILQERGPFHFELLIVTHTHQDHIGCLPTLVASGQITAGWALVADPDLGYGPESALDAVEVPEAVRLALLALREESHATDQDPAALWEFLLDAGRQQTSYRGMIEALKKQGTRVVAFLGSDDERSEYLELVEAFHSIGLEILGPTREHLQICAAVVDRIGRDAVDAAVDVARRSDAGSPVADAADLYRRLVAADAAGGGLNDALNDQSVVAAIAFQDRRILLTGDMQLAIPGVRGLGEEMRQLRSRISSLGPYDLVKIPHHGSENAFDEAVLTELGSSRLFIISTGRDPRDPHPAPEVLALLSRRRDELEWLRTDRNGLTSFVLHEERVRMFLSGGAVNDASLNGRNAVATPPPPDPKPPLQPSITVDRDLPWVEVTARIPHQATRVTITVDVQPPLGMGARTGFPAVVRQPPFLESAPRPLRLAWGRPLPLLLFVTSSQALAGKIGPEATGLLLRGLREAGMRVEDLPPEALGEAALAAQSVHRHLASPEAREVRGIVLIGGYDVLPSQRFDCLEIDLEPAVNEAVARGRAEQDPDHFLIWSDDIYADKAGKTLPALPVSRIPDGGSVSLLWAALEAGSPIHRGKRSGIRNVRRPFADSIFSLLSGQGEMHRSEPVQFDQSPSIDTQAEYLYLMLHGEHTDAAYFLGEREQGEWPRAIGLQNIGPMEGAVVFAGCCWGGLPVHEPAALAEPGARLTPHTADTSLALRFLAAGARAFVGCTGVHYSPGLHPPAPHFGAPLHEAFWRGCCAGVPPARALLEAKLTYLQEMPHGIRTAFGQAVEEKTLRQFTCLGLGW